MYFLVKQYIIIYYIYSVFGKEAPWVPQDMLKILWTEAQKLGLCCSLRWLILEKKHSSLYCLGPEGEGRTRSYVLEIVLESSPHCKGRDAKEWLQGLVFVHAGFWRLELLVAALESSCASLDMPGGFAVGLLKKTRPFMQVRIPAQLCMCVHSHFVRAGGCALVSRLGSGEPSCWTSKTKHGGQLQI